MRLKRKKYSFRSSSSKQEKKEQLLKLQGMSPEEIHDLFVSMISELKQKEKEVFHLPQIMAQNEELKIIGEENKLLIANIAKMKEELAEAKSKLSQLADISLWLDVLHSVDQEIWKIFQEKDQTWTVKLKNGREVNGITLLEALKNRKSN